MRVGIRAHWRDGEGAMAKEIQRETIRQIALRAKAMGGRAMLVGGCVRDALLGRESADIDCEVYGLTPEQLHALAAQFGTVDESGARYGIFTLKDAGIDLAVPRLERRIGPKHGDFDVTANPALSFEQAAARRDFTVNAILQDALTGEIVDPFGGEVDLRRGILRATPGEGFCDDPLRVLRGAQFASRFHLSPDEETIARMRTMKTDDLSPARVLGEMKKAMAGDAPDVFFDVLRQAGALEPWFGELAALIDVPQPSCYHPEGDAYIHSMLVLHAAAQKKAQAEKPEAFVYAALTHDLGKAISTTRGEDGEWHANGHENTGVPLARAMLGRLGAGKEIIAYCENMCRLHMRAHVCYYVQVEAGRTNLLYDESVCPHDLALLAACDSMGKGSAGGDAPKEEAFLMGRVKIYQETIAGGMPSGGMLLAGGMKPGPELAKALGEARRRALLGEDAQEAVKAVLKQRKFE